MARPRYWIVSSLTLLLAVAGATCPMSAQSRDAVNPRNVDASSFGQSIDLSRVWLFSPGDNPAYASPTFDDSGWKTISTQKELLSYGYRDYAFCWYRVHVHLPLDARNVMVGLQLTSGAYEVFVNGVRIGARGPMGHHSGFTQYSLRSYIIPANVLVASHGEIVLALRFSVEASGDRGVGTSMPLDSNSRVMLESPMAASRNLSYQQTHLAMVWAILAALGTC